MAVEEPQRKMPRLGGDTRVEDNGYAGKDGHDAK
jgi:hypothetical protein